jgi:hypothetical protein
LDGFAVPAQVMLTVGRLPNEYEVMEDHYLISEG